MEHRNLGRYGLKVSEICFGTMTFDGGFGMWKAIGQVPREGATALGKAAFDAGVNFFDTADVYSKGVSERMLGEALRSLGLPVARSSSQQKHSAAPTWARTAAAPRASI